MAKKILHLTLKKKPFDLIAQDKKKIEYRKVKPYWTNRLFDGFRPISHKRIPKVFDEIWFRNGYKKDCPFMRIVCKEIREKTSWFQGELCYSIKLGKILELKCQTTK